MSEWRPSSVPKTATQLRELCSKLRQRKDSRSRLSVGSVDFDALQEDQEIRDSQAFIPIMHWSSDYFVFHGLIIVRERLLEVGEFELLFSEEAEDAERLKRERLLPLLEVGDE